MNKRSTYLEKITVGLLLTASAGIAQSAVPSDTLYPYSYLGWQWGLHKLNMDEVWDYTRGHAYIAPLDSGIQTDHPDLQANYRPHFSFDFGNDVPGGTRDANVDEMEGTTSLSSIGHGTHVAGIIAASSDNGEGVAGVCWNCSLMIGKTRVYPLIYSDDVIRKANGIKGMVKWGTQVINMSWGSKVSEYLTSLHSGCDEIPASYGNHATNTNTRAAFEICEALAFAEEMDVVLVAAAGNDRGVINGSLETIDFPATDPRVIAVGAVDVWGYVPYETTPGPEKDLVAPGVNILSTFYTDAIYNDALLQPYFQMVQPNCADYLGGPSGYGPCTGTSMAAPHVSGIVGLLRSVNPLLTKDQIKDVLTKHASFANSKNDFFGYGVPNVKDSVEELIGQSNGQQLTNRLTPLFSLYSDDGEDSFYTTKPQMAMAAISGTLEPQPGKPSRLNHWTSTGLAIPGYNSFPNQQSTGAEVYIFSTHNNPVNPGSELVPLYRLSYEGPNQSNNFWSVDHVYTTEQAGIDAYLTENYKLDGIEGYIYPRDEPQPAGTVKLYRKYNQARDDHAIFPESQLTHMASQGYTINSGNEWIGYVYPNLDSDNDGLIDGYEIILGTSVSNPDSDFDGISDGDEVNGYPASDPMIP